MKKFRIVALLLVMCLASSCFVGGTFAKYASEATATGEANIAKWSIKFDNADIAKNDVISVADLLGSVTDTHDGGTRTIGTHVSEDVMAPGTKGVFTYEVTNASEVAAEFDFSITPQEIGTLSSPITYVIEISNTTSSNTNNDDLVGPNETVTYTVSWEWTFTNADENDYAGKVLTSDVSFRATQVD